ncbi:hypothetical protein XELAEV_18021170mg [Xenopus laevis]|uniref:Uncharacterized protein n=1 Tax=Xenopus laevis TaxID=8355 RepID=A0A974D9Y8_XENLA|nr:hypothetical protein XELAEV_18021170mg [Xenopus laevis]
MFCAQEALNHRLKVHKRTWHLKNKQRTEKKTEKKHTLYTNTLNSSKTLYKYSKGTKRLQKKVTQNNSQPFFHATIL